MATESPTHHAPVWLFSFVDLAFLLLIAMTQLEEGREIAVELGEIVVPRIHASAEGMPGAAAARWQLRVHPPATAAEPSTTAAAQPPTGAAAGDPAQGDAARPYSLVLPRDDGSEPPAERLDADALRAKLLALHGDDVARPLLAPHADSRSQDLLDAVSILEAVWPERRRALVAPDLAAK
jgi:hypothetical protein